ncbi:MAG TPA: 50S ribosomal protein L6 [Candidatus Paceibacterota bacterium]|nr:50S ribosomal protein L6 [Candidatus Paceibacterota bacterium]
MSRLIKKPIAITGGATLVESRGILTIKGPKGELKITVPHGVTLKTEGENFWITTTAEMETTAIQGTVWALVKNAIEGVTTGFTKVLEIEGVGYRAVIEGKELVLFLGYALPVRVSIPENVTITVDKNTIKVVGIDKDAVGQAAAEIRALKKPEPYKGKGIHYQGEVIRRKVGKKAGAAAA